MLVDGVDLSTVGGQQGAGGASQVLDGECRPRSSTTARRHGYRATAGYHGCSLLPNSHLLFDRPGPPPRVPLTSSGPRAVEGTWCETALPVGPQLALLPRAVTRRCRRRMLGRAGEPEEHRLADLIPRPDLDRAGWPTLDSSSVTCPREPGRDESRGRVLSGRPSRPRLTCPLFPQKAPAGPPAPQRFRVPGPKRA